MTPPDLHTLTGAYVLNALSTMERKLFEQHLAVCPSCAEEVAELGEAAARLGATVAADPPPSLRAKVMTAVAESRQLPPPVDPVTAIRPSRGGRVRWLRGVAATVAAAALIVAVVLGYQSVLRNQELSRQVDALRQVNDDYRQTAELLGAPDARVVSRGSEAPVFAAVSLSRGTAMVMPRALAPAPPEHVYQVWIARGGAMHSAGLLPAAPDRPLLAHGVAPGDQLGLTVEPRGGSPQPTTSPLVLLPL